MNSKAVSWELFLIGIGVIFYLFEFSHGIHGDASVRYESLLTTLRTGHFAPMVYSYVQPFFSAPLLLLGYVFKDGFWWVSRFNAFLILALTWFAARTSRLWAGWDSSRVRLLALLLLGATMFPKHSTDYYAEVFCAVFALFSILFYQANRSWLAILAISFSVWNGVATILGGGALLTYFAIRTKRWRYLAALPLLPAGFLLENYLKYGEFYPTAYLAMQAGPHTMLHYAMGPGFSYPLFFGLLNVVFSFGRGVLWFAPGLVLLFHPALWKGDDRARDLIRASMLYLTGLILIYAKFWAWHAGSFWGPRYFLFASILAVYVLALLDRELTPFWRTIWICVTLLSCWVACQGVLFGTDFLEDCFKQDHEFEFVCWYVPEYSVIWRFFVVGPPITGRRVAYLIFFLLVAGTVIWPRLLSLVGDALAMGKSLWRDYRPQSNWRA